MVDPALPNFGETLPPRVSEQIDLGANYAIGRMFASLALYRIERPGERVLAGGGAPVLGYVGDQRH